MQAKCRLAGGAPDGGAPEGGAPAGGVLLGVVSEVDKYVALLGGPNTVLKVSILSPVLPDFEEADMILMLVEEMQG